MTLDGSTINISGANWPLPAGKYDVYFHCCGGYEVIAGPVTITVAKGDGDADENGEVIGDEGTGVLTEESQGE